jgi:DNA polymerase-3 subunit delta'
VKDMRTWIDQLSESPYEDQHLYILNKFDEASLSAMNASLKILEEPPRYAKILLVVSNPEALLETIRSRTITYRAEPENRIIGEDSEEALR